MLSVIRDGIQYPLDDGTYCYYVGDDGWGMTPVHRLAERGPQQHGDSDKGFRLDPRVGHVVLFITGTSREDLFARRSQLLDIFAPSSTPLALRWELSNGVTKQIDVHYIGDMSYSSDQRSGFNQRLAVTLKAPNPTFYDPAGQEIEFALGGGSGAMTIPLTIPHFVGASTLDLATPVIYEGSWITQPHLIRIGGPIDDPKIINETTGELLSFPGVTILAGDYYDIDARYGYKTVRNAAGDSKISELSNDSDLATFHLRPGPNSIRVTGTNITEATRVTINFYERYLGI